MTPTAMARGGIGPVPECGPVEWRLPRYPLEFRGAKTDTKPIDPVGSAQERGQVG